MLVKIENLRFKKALQRVFECKSEVEMLSHPSYESQEASNAIEYKNNNYKPLLTLLRGMLRKRNAMQWNLKSVKHRKRSFDSISLFHPGIT